MTIREFSFLDHITCPVFVLELNEAGHPVYVAFNTYALTASQRPLSDYLGHTAAQVYDGRLGQSAYERHVEVFANGETTTYEVQLPIGGAIRSLRTTLSPVKDAAGRTTRLYGSSVNISATQAAREAKVSFETLSSEIEQFVALAAHDLRTPMRNVAILADLLREDFEDHGDGKLQLIDMLEDLAEKSMGLIADVLAHTQTTSVAPDTTVFNFRGLAQEIFDVLDPQGIHVLRCTGSEICADRTAMQIALRNLIDNALKHAGRAQVEVDIGVRADFEGMLEVLLHDNGRGFDDPARVFDEDGKIGSDSGYGLMGIRRLINARGGVIEAGNDLLRGGSQVRFTLPGTWVADVNRIGNRSDIWHDDTVPLPKSVLLRPETG